MSTLHDIILVRPALKLNAKMVWRCLNPCCAEHNYSVPLGMTGSTLVCTVPLKEHTCDPQEDDAIILQDLNVHLAHLVICHGAIWQILVYLPGRISHDHTKLAQHAHVKGADVTGDPLRLTQGL